MYWRPSVATRTGVLNPRNIFVLATGIGFAAYLFRIRNFDGLPSGDGWKVRILCSQSRIYSLLARLGSLLHIDTEINILRQLYRMGSSRASLTLAPEVFVEAYEVEGVKALIYRRVSGISAEGDLEEPLKPVVIYLHGGGWVFSSPAERDAHQRHLTEQLDAVIVAVDYRKAPEHPYPAGLLDCVSVVKDIYFNSLRFGIDKSSISICGDSAGGNLAAAVALKLRDEGLRFLKNQILIYPSVQFLNFQLNSYLERENYMLSRRDCCWCALVYMNEDVSLIEAIMENDHLAFAEHLYSHPGFLALQKYESAEPSQSRALVDLRTLQRYRKKVMDPYLCPLMARSMKGLPRSLILLSDCDVLLDDGLAYADRLTADQVPVTVVRIGGYHGAFRNFQFTKCGALMMQTVVKYLQEHM